MENILAYTHEVATYNPFFRYWEYLNSLGVADESGLLG